jgi:hypothetical protein
MLGTVRCCAWNFELFSKEIENVGLGVEECEVSTAGLLKEVRGREKTKV